MRTIERVPTPNNETTINGIKVNARTAAVLQRKEQERREKLKSETQYNPWDATAFLARLKTFSDLTTWTPGKPDAINEVVWAKRGWVCDGLNRVACKRGCEARVFISLRPKRKDAEGKEIEGSEDFSEEVSDELVKRYEVMVVGAHKESCLWRVGRGCADDIYRIGVVRGEVWQRELRERYSSFHQLQSNGTMPARERLDCPVDLRKITQELGQDFFENAPVADSTDKASAAPATTMDEASIDLTALSLALLGWQLPTGAASKTTPTATCNTCFRRVGLWLYTQPPTPNEEDPMKLDLVSSHRHYCPWINDQSQAMPAGTFEGLPAYEVLTRVVTGWSGMKARARRNGVGSARMRKTSGHEVQLTGNPVVQEAEEEGASRPSSSKSRDEVREEDRKKFARLRELTRMMGLKKLRKKPDDTSTNAANTATVE